MDRPKELKPQFESVAAGLLARAPAKINLALLIADKRPDGYHNLETIMHKITFYDELLFERTKQEGIELICNGLWSPGGRENLVHKAAEMFYQEIGEQPEIKITLTKNIPAGTGLGGASSDAATTLLALNKIHNNPLADGQLQKLTARLGSDVSFFLAGPMAYCTGRGETFTKIDKNFQFAAILIMPNINVSTKMIYDNFKADLPLFEALKQQIKPLLLKNRVDLITKMCANMLAKTCFLLNNDLALLKVKIEQLCRLPVALSGSGCAMFVIIDNKDYCNTDLLQREIINTFDCNCIIVFDNQW
ncbi:MAG TPA: 4-(cytidine 5'-diphospho)-2-C-methyl-D-erythritol kinase [Phycisphaerales bacterium]|nr:MAG: 4-(cytidine 5'-diphospho)-2-C-methyl-D-erythritol kinase [Planctomycetes bacterium GWC2_45_44]HBG78748.1 4-(cytidine 5'-diphospho)-2-C-methyl-D-erythritol kinase [Phycisphaerales bacterium]HBR20067.1 4-(cytidine 5'-diphospho)-2-C-methyl-D-erythritol kinase [Phycisphaerales bacterium]